MPFTLRHDKPLVLFLAGDAWMVNHIDSRTRIVFVEASANDRKSRWLGRGQPLSFELRQTINAFLSATTPGARRRNAPEAE
jgi:Lhr-like helicase